MADTRKDRRAPVSLKVRFKSATVDEFIEQYAKDISRGGLFIKSKKPMPVGTLLKFEFQLKDESRLIHGVGRVVWKREEGESEGADNPAGMGIKFIKMDPSSRAMVDKIVHSRGDGEDVGEFESGNDPRRIPSRKPTQQFFPSTTPADEMPAPEDRTQVRHASEFLASALSEADVDSAQEAAGEAKEARKRTEEIQRQREEDAVRRREEREAQELADRERNKATTQAPEPAGAGSADASDTDQADGKAAAEAAAFAALAAMTEQSRREAEGVDAALHESDSEFGPGEPETHPPPPGALDPELPFIGFSEGREVDPEAPTLVGKRPSDPAALRDTPVPGQADRDGSERDDGDADEVTPRPIVEPAAARGPRLDPGDRAPARMDSSPPERQRSFALPIGIGIAAVAAIAYFGYQFATATSDAADPAVADSAQPPVEADEPEVVEPEVVEPEPEPSVAVQVTSTPEGADVTVDGENVGRTPTEVTVPEGREVTLAVRLRGHVEAAQQVTGYADMEPIAVELAPMTYVLAVESEPPGARVVAATRRTTTPGEIELTGAASEPITVTFVRPGFQRAQQTVEPGSFEERDGRMIASVTVTLEARARPVATATGGGAAGGAAAGGGAAGGAAGGGAAGEGAAGDGEAGDGDAAGDGEAGSPTEPEPDPAPGGTAGGGTVGGGTAGGGTTMGGGATMAGQSGGEDLPDNPF